VILAIRKEEGRIPGGGFHYLTHPIEIPAPEAPLWDLMGYELIELDREKGERLLREASAALVHQVEVAYLIDGPNPAPRVPTTARPT
jgi:hypothetical protein